MAKNWTELEKSEGRCLVVFDTKQSQATLNVSFERARSATLDPDSTYVSCIWWKEEAGAYITSVDTMTLLESILGMPFSIEEKNRVRRNLEVFKPVTITKTKKKGHTPPSSGVMRFFDVLMAFGPPRPRNIEKDVKVFAWEDLEGVIEKVVGKFVSLNLPRYNRRTKVT